MKLIYKIFLVHLALVFLFTFITSFSLGGFNGADFLVFAGLFSLMGGAIDIIIGLLLLAFKRKESGKGFLLSAGLLLLLGFTVCSSTLWAF
jgi:hypothetical protein